MRLSHIIDKSKFWQGNSLMKKHLLNIYPLQSTNIMIRAEDSHNEEDSWSILSSKNTQRGIHQTTA
jgi:hypothetical protein